MFKKIREILEVMTRKNTTLRFVKSKKIFKDETPLMWNIYGARTNGEALERFHKVHYVFKYKLWLPVIMLAQSILKKYLGKPIPKTNYNKNIIVFDEAFEKSIKSWVGLYMSDKNPDGSPKEECIERFMKCDSVKALQTMKELAEIMYLNDTAYREFINILMHNIAHGMYEKYQGKTINHLMYTSKNVYNVNYVLMYDKVEETDMTKQKGETYVQ